MFHFLEKLMLMCIFRLDYIPQGYTSSTDGMKKLEADVKDASSAYTEAEKEEDEALADLRRYQGIAAGAIPKTRKDTDLMSNSEKDLQKIVDTAAKRRRKLRGTLDKRIKARDTASELKSDMIEKKEGQIYFDGTVYTARWSALPR